MSQATSATCYILPFPQLAKRTIMSSQKVTPTRRSAASALMVASPAFSQSSEEFAASGTHIPRHVLAAFRQSGCRFSRGCGLTLVEIENNTAGRAILDEFLGSLTDDDDPLLSVADAQSRRAELECRIILHQFAGLSKGDFDRQHHLQLASMAAPPTDVRFHHSAFALSAVAYFMANPGVRFPCIHALPIGTHVCKIRQIWAKGTTITFDVVRS